MFDSLKNHLAVFRQAWRHERETAGSRPERGEHAFLPAALEVMEQPASPAGRLVLWLLVGFFSIAALWAGLSHVDIVAVATGKTLPRERVKYIQASELGIVRALHVSEGDRVREGDVLITLDPTFADADADQARHGLLVAEQALARATALARALDGGRPAFAAPAGTPASDIVTQQALVDSRAGEFRAAIAGLERQREEETAGLSATLAQLAKLRETLPLVEDQMKAREELMDKGLSPRLLYLELKERHIAQVKDIEIQTEQETRAHAAVRALDSRIEETRQRFRNAVLQELADAADQAKLRRAELDKATRRGALQTLRAPVAGTVQQIAVHTIGGVIQPAEPIMVIVPGSGELMVEAMVLNRDIGTVVAGDTVEVKLEAFPFTKYGVIHGRIESLSLDAIQDENLGLVYAAQVALDRSTIRVKDRDIPLSPGMAVTVEIKTGARRLIEFLIDPLLRYRDEAMRER